MDNASHSLSAWVGGIAVLAGVGASLALLWLLPGSPVTAWRADQALLEGNAERAASLYDDVADHGWWQDARLRALDRGARVHASHLRDAAGARQRLERLLTVTQDASRRAMLRERLGWVAVDSGQHSAASVAFEAAHDADPTSTAASERLVLAARQAVAASELERSENLWLRLAGEHPPRRAEAHLALGRLALRADQAQRAHRLFTLASQEATRADVEVAARLGAATALERLGSLDGAIAEIDDAELPSGVVESRLDALRSRRASREP